MRVLADRMRQALIEEGLIPANTDARTLLVVVELGDRVLDLAFRENGPDARSSNSAEPLSAPMSERRSRPAPTSPRRSTMTAISSPCSRAPLPNEGRVALLATSPT